MALEYPHEYLVGFLHSEGMGREFIETPAKVSSPNDVLMLERKIQATTGFSGVKVFTFQLLGVRTCLKR